MAAGVRGGLPRPDPPPRSASSCWAARVSSAAGCRRRGGGVGRVRPAGAAWQAAARLQPRWAVAARQQQGGLSDPIVGHGGRRGGPAGGAVVTVPLATPSPHQLPSLSLLLPPRTRRCPPLYAPRRGTSAGGELRPHPLGAVEIAAPLVTPRFITPHAASTALHPRARRGSCALRFPLAPPHPSPPRPPPTLPLRLPPPPPPRLFVRFPPPPLPPP